MRTVTAMDMRRSPGATWKAARDGEETTVTIKRRGEAVPVAQVVPMPPDGHFRVTLSPEELHEVKEALRVVRESQVTFCARDTHEVIDGLLARLPCPGCLDTGENSAGSFCYCPVGLALEEELDLFPDGEV